jgi:hypothetical protein
MMVDPMPASSPIPSGERIVDTMVQLALAAKSHRVIVAGSSALDIYLDLQRRGFSRVATIATCRIPCGQHDVALVAGQHSNQGLEALLTRIVSFLNTQATIAVWVGTDEQQRGKKLQLLLERLGFRIEAGARCESGFVLSARRRNSNHIAKAA